MGTKCLHTHHRKIEFDAVLTEMNDPDLQDYDSLLQLYSCCRESSLHEATDSSSEGEAQGEGKEETKKCRQEVPESGTKEDVSIKKEEGVREIRLVPQGAELGHQFPAGVKDQKRPVEEKTQLRLRSQSLSTVRFGDSSGGCTQPVRFPHATDLDSVWDGAAETGQWATRSQPEVVKQLSTRSQPEVVKQLNTRSQPEVVKQLNTRSQPEVVKQLNTRSQPEVVKQLNTRSHPEGTNQMSARGHPGQSENGSVNCHPEGTNQMSARGHPGQSENGSVNCHPEGTNQMSARGHPGQSENGSVNCHPEGTNQMSARGHPGQSENGSVNCHPEGTNQMSARGHPGQSENGSVNCQSEGIKQMSARGHLRQSGYSSANCQSEGTKQMTARGHPGQSEHSSANCQSEGTKQMTARGHPGQSEHSSANCQSEGTKQMTARGHPGQSEHSSANCQSEGTKQMTARGHPGQSEQLAANCQDEGTKQMTARGHPGQSEHLAANCQDEGTKQMTARGHPGQSEQLAANCQDEGTKQMTARGHPGQSEHLAANCQDEGTKQMTARGHPGQSEQLAANCQDEGIQQANTRGHPGQNEQSTARYLSEGTKQMNAKGQPEKQQQLTARSLQEKNLEQMTARSQKEETQQMPTKDRQRGARHWTTEDRLESKHVTAEDTPSNSQTMITNSGQEGNKNFSAKEICGEFKHLTVKKQQQGTQTSTTRVREGTNKRLNASRNISKINRGGWMREGKVGEELGFAENPVQTSVTMQDTTPLWKRVMGKKNKQITEREEDCPSKKDLFTRLQSSVQKQDRVVTEGSSLKKSQKKEAGGDHLVGHGDPAENADSVQSDEDYVFSILMSENLQITEEQDSIPTLGSVRSWNPQTAEALANNGALKGEWWQHLNQETIRKKVIFEEQYDEFQRSSRGPNPVRHLSRSSVSRSTSEESAATDREPQPPHLFVYSEKIGPKTFQEEKPVHTDRLFCTRRQANLIDFKSELSASSDRVVSAQCSQFDQSVQPERVVSGQPDGVASSQHGKHTLALGRTDNYISLKPHSNTFTQQDAFSSAQLNKVASAMLFEMALGQPSEETCGQPDDSAFLQQGKAYAASFKADRAASAHHKETVPLTSDTFWGQGHKRAPSQPDTFATAQQPEISFEQRGRAEELVESSLSQPQPVVEHANCTASPERKPCTGTTVLGLRKVVVPTVTVVNNLSPFPSCDKETPFLKTSNSGKATLPDNLTSQVSVNTQPGMHIPIIRALQSDVSAQQTMPNKFKQFKMAFVSKQASLGSCALGRGKLESDTATQCSTTQKSGLKILDTSVSSKDDSSAIPTCRSVHSLCSGDRKANASHHGQSDGQCTHEEVSSANYDCSSDYEENCSKRGCFLDPVKKSGNVSVITRPPLSPEKQSHSISKAPPLKKLSDLRSQVNAFRHPRAATAQGTMQTKALPGETASGVGGEGDDPSCLLPRSINSPHCLHLDLHGPGTLTCRNSGPKSAYSSSTSSSSYQTASEFCDGDLDFKSRAESMQEEKRCLSTGLKALCSPKSFVSNLRHTPRKETEEEEASPDCSITQYECLDPLRYSCTKQNGPDTASKVKEKFAENGHPVTEDKHNRSATEDMYNQLATEATHGSCASKTMQSLSAAETKQSCCAGFEAAKASPQECSDNRPAEILLGMNTLGTWREGMTNVWVQKGGHVTVCQLSEDYTLEQNVGVQEGVPDGRERQCKSAKEGETSSSSSISEMEHGAAQQGQRAITCTANAQDATGRHPVGAPGAGQHCGAENTVPVVLECRNLMQKFDSKGNTLTGEGHQTNQKHNSRTANKISNKSRCENKKGEDGNKDAMPQTCTKLQETDVTAQKPSHSSVLVNSATFGGKLCSNTNMSRTGSDAVAGNAALGSGLTVSYLKSWSQVRSINSTKLNTQDNSCSSIKSIPRRNSTRSKLLQNSSGSVPKHSSAGSVLQHSSTGSSLQHDSTGSVLQYSSAGYTLQHNLTGSSLQQQTSESAPKHNSAGSLLQHSSAGCASLHNLTGLTPQHSLTASHLHNDVGGFTPQNNSVGSSVQHSCTDSTCQHSSVGSTLPHKLTGSGDSVLAPQQNVNQARQNLIRSAVKISPAKSPSKRSAVKSTPRINPKSSRPTCQTALTSARSDCSDNLTRCTPKENLSQITPKKRSTGCTPKVSSTGSATRSVRSAPGKDLNSTRCTPLENTLVSASQQSSTKSFQQSFSNGCTLRNSSTKIPPREDSVRCNSQENSAVLSPWKVFTRCTPQENLIRFTQQKRSLRSVSLENSAQSYKENLVGSAAKENLVKTTSTKNLVRPMSTERMARLISMKISMKSTDPQQNSVNCTLRKNSAELMRQTLRGCTGTTPGKSSAGPIPCNSSTHCSFQQSFSSLASQSFERTGSTKEKVYYCKNRLYETKHASQAQKQIGQPDERGMSNQVQVSADSLDNVSNGMSKTARRCTSAAISQRLEELSRPVRRAKSARVKILAEGQSKTLHKKSPRKRRKQLEERGDMSQRPQRCKKGVRPAPASDISLSRTLSHGDHSGQNVKNNKNASVNSTRTLSEVKSSSSVDEGKTAIQLWNLPRVGKRKRCRRRKRSSKIVQVSGVEEGDSSIRSNLTEHSRNPAEGQKDEDQSSSVLLCVSYKKRSRRRKKAKRRKVWRQMKEQTNPPENKSSNRVVSTNEPLVKEPLWKKIQQKKDQESRAKPRTSAVGGEPDMVKGQQVLYGPKTSSPPVSKIMMVTTTKTPAVSSPLSAVNSVCGANSEYYTPVPWTSPIVSTTDLLQTGVTCPDDNPEWSDDVLDHVSDSMYKAGESPAQAGAQTPGTDPALNLVKEIDSYFHNLMLGKGPGAKAAVSRDRVSKLKEEAAVKSSNHLNGLCDQLRKINHQTDFSEEDVLELFAKASHSDSGLAVSGETRNCDRAFSDRGVLRLFPQMPHAAQRDISHSISSTSSASSTSKRSMQRKKSDRREETGQDAPSSYSTHKPFVASAHPSHSREITSSFSVNPESCLLLSKHVSSPASEHVQLPDRGDHSSLSQTLSLSPSEILLNGATPQDVPTYVDSKEGLMKPEMSRTLFSGVFTHTQLSRELPMTTAENSSAQNSGAATLPSHLASKGNLFGPSSAPHIRRDLPNFLCVGKHIL